MPRLRSVLLALLVPAVLAPPAAAHVQVTPATAAPGDPVRFEVLIPGERSDAHTVGVALRVPAGVLPFSFHDQPGWKRTLEPADGSVRVIRWRGRLAPDGFVQFSFLAATPEREGELVWKAVQRYDDGHEAAWIGPPDSDQPAPVTRISTTAARQNAGGEGAQDSGTSQADDGDAENTVGMALGAAALLLAAAALVVALRRPRSAA